MEIIIKNGKKAFGDNVIFENINMKFEKGKFYLIKGYNGCGKTVLLKTICGYMFLTSGSVFQDDIEIGRKNRYIKDAGIVIENPQFLAHLTMLENLNLLKKMSKKITDEKINEWIEKYNIEKFKNTKFKNLSLGTKQKMVLIQAFIHEPEILILDEPFHALDAESLKMTEESIKTIKDNVIIILSTHINDNIKYMSDYEYVFNDRKLELINE